MVDGSNLTSVGGEQVDREDRRMGPPGRGGLRHRETLAPAVAWLAHLGDDNLLPRLFWPSCEIVKDLPALAGVGEAREPF